MKTKTTVKPNRPSKKHIAALQEVSRLVANCKTHGEQWEAVWHDPNLFFTWFYFSPERRKLAAELAEGLKNIPHQRLWLKKWREDNPNDPLVVASLKAEAEEAGTARNT